MINTDKRDSLLKKWEAIAGNIFANSDHEYNLQWGTLREKFYEENGPIPCSIADMERLSTLKDVFKGERIFILGNGPSINHTPLEFLKDEFTFVTNRIYLLFDRIDWRPTFYTATDWRVVPDIAHEINLLTGMIFFFEERFRGLLRDNDDDIYWHTHMSNPRERVFAYDIANGVRGAGSVTGTAIQIAFYLGFSPIYLIGCDLGYKVGDTVKQEGPDKFGTGTKHYLTSTEDDDYSHFDKRYFGQGRRWHDPNVKRMIEGHRQCKEGIEKVGGKIYNATIGGELEVYERVDFKSLFPRPKHMVGKQLLQKIRQPIQVIYPVPEPSIGNCLLGPFARCEHMNINETQIVFHLWKHTETGVMVDVGAHHGSSLLPFAENGWRVYAFEPDTQNRSILHRRVSALRNVSVDKRAVSDTTECSVPFYSSSESSGISSLKPFSKSHFHSDTVDTVTLTDFCSEQKISHIDLLKIDVEGYDLMVLKGVPWDTIKPNVIICEFEDKKTESLGYTMHDMARYLTGRGYKIVLSEWYPIIRYGIRHDWHRLVPYPCELHNQDAWGNLIAFRDQPDLHKIATTARNSVKVDTKRIVSRDRGLYQKLVGYLERNHPTIITIGRLAIWSLATLKKTFFGIGGIALLVIVGLYVAGALIEPARWYLVGIASALLLLCGGLLALTYIRSSLNRIIGDQRKQVRDIHAQISNINKQVSNIQQEVAPYNEPDRIRLERAVSIEKQVEMAELQYDLRDSKPVLFFNTTSGPGTLTFASTAGLIISWALRLSGHRVLHLVCRKGLRRCIQGTNQHELNQPMPCEKCYAIRSKMFPRDLRWYLEPKSDVPSALIPLESYSLDELSDLVYQGINIGELCTSSVRWTLRRHNLDSDLRSTRLLREYIRGGMNIVDTLQRLLQEQELHSMVVFNGVFYPEAIARAVALQKGLPVVAYEISIPNLKVFLSHGIAAGGGLIPIPKDFQMSANQEADLDEYMSQRTRGTAGQPGLWPEMKGIEPDLQALLDQYKNVVSVFTNVIFDTSQYGANTVFESMFDWLDEIMKLASLHPETLFVVRAHPAEVLPRHESEELVGDWLKEHSYLTIPNVRFIPPTDYISSYELLNISRFCLVYNSTIGLEAVVLGIPTVTAAAGRYSGAGVTHAPASRKAYRKLVEKFLKNGPPPVEDTVQQQARYCMYQLFFRQGLDLSAFLEAPGWTLKPIGASALHPDNSPEMNITYKGIMEGGPFYYPP